MSSSAVSPAAPAAHASSAAANTISLQIFGIMARARLKVSRDFSHCPQYVSTRSNVPKDLESISTSSLSICSQRPSAASHLRSRPSAIIANAYEVLSGCTPSLFIMVSTSIAWLPSPDFSQPLSILLYVRAVTSSPAERISSSNSRANCTSPLLPAADIAAFQTEGSTEDSLRKASKMPSASCHCPARSHAAMADVQVNSFGLISFSSMLPRRPKIAEYSPLADNTAITDEYETTFGFRPRPCMSSSSSTACSPAVPQSFSSPSFASAPSPSYTFSVVLSMAMTSSTLMLSGGNNAVADNLLFLVVRALFEASSLERLTHAPRA
mmetsp:Transcript_100628/g.178581  ORF Transcript_100628/g.178581 Transcript_100628/m.178581 type:complete len:324 (-) Transcript_100628:382-1353(-)